MTDGGDNLLRPPAAASSARFPSSFGTRFWVTVDTEEDFDWDAPFARDGFRLDSVPALAACQAYFHGAGVAPIYLVDWPIVQDDRARDILVPAIDAAEAEVGAQLHPWVNPPHTEDVTERNSYTGNLPLALQREKLAALRDGITERLGRSPLIYRAGRYGLGKHTAALLREMGFRCDTSVRSGFDYRKGHGPDYRASPVTPWWAGAGEDSILEVPVTTVFAGALRNRWRGLYHLAAQPHSLAGAAMARLGLIERIALTPEGIPADKACHAIDLAIEAGVPLLNFSFHSPSLQPGNTPYVRDAADLAAFYRWWDRVLAHLDARGVRPTTLAEVLREAR